MRRARFAALALAGWRKRMVAKVKQVVVVGGLGGRPIDRLCDSLKSSKCCADTLIVRDRSLQQSDDLRDRHRLRIGITGSPTQPQQETAVSGDAIAHLAEPREVDKKSFLEEGRKGASR